MCEHRPHAHMLTYTQHIIGDKHGDKHGSNRVANKLKQGIKPLSRAIFNSAIVLTNISAMGSSMVNNVAPNEGSVFHREL